MKRSSGLWRMIRLSLSPYTQLDRQIREEFDQHLEQRATWYADQGLDKENARNAAIESFGNIDEAIAECRASALQTRWYGARILSIASCVCSAILLLALALVGSALAGQSRSIADVNEMLQRAERTAMLRDADMRSLADEMQEVREEAVQLRAELLAVNSGSRPDMLQAFYTITIRGKARKTGTWLLPKEESMTLGQIVSTVGVTNDASGSIVLTQRLGEAEPRISHIQNAFDHQNAHLSIALVGDCDIEIQ